ncbi:hypothetical protein RB595_006175 [Gaeumannomyces hyphopodioides]
MKRFTHHFLLLLATLLPLFALALPADPPYQQDKLPRQTSSCDGGTGNGGQNGGQGLGTPGSPGSSAVTAQQQRGAVSAWRADTGKVSHFLDTATTFAGEEYTQQAQIALDAELDELTHKKVLDQALGGQPQVQAASNVLETQGFFQQVVDVLRRMIRDGSATAARDVDVINRNRCVNVLPNIDAYFAAAGQPQTRAVRPAACAQVPGAPENAAGAGRQPPAPPGPAAQPPQPPAGGPARVGKGKSAKAKGAKVKARRVAALQAKPYDRD